MHAAFLRILPRRYRRIEVAARWQFVCCHITQVYLVLVVISRDEPLAIISLFILYGVSLHNAQLYAARTGNTQHHDVCLWLYVYNRWRFRNRKYRISEIWNDAVEKMWEWTSAAGAMRRVYIGLFNLDLECRPTIGIGNRTSTCRPK